MGHSSVAEIGAMIPVVIPVVWSTLLPQTAMEKAKSMRLSRREEYREVLEKVGHHQTDGRTTCGFQVAASREEHRHEVLHFRYRLSWSLRRE